MGSLLNFPARKNVSTPVNRRVIDAPWYDQLTAAALDIRASVGTSTSPTITGNKAVTGVPFQPKLVMPFGVQQPTDGSGFEPRLHIGAAMSAASRFNIAELSINGVTTSNTFRRHSNASVVSSIAAASGAVNLEADFSSFAGDGFTLNWSTVDATARILNHICLGGSDLEVVITQQEMNNTNLPQSFAHGMSGPPTGLLFLTVWEAITTPTTSDSLLFSIGMWTASAQLNAHTYALDGVTTMNTKRSLFNNAVSFVTGSTGTLARAMAVATVDGTNVNCTYPYTVAAGLRQFWMIAIRGAKCQVGTFDCNNSLSPLSISTPGIKPKLFLPVFVPTGVDSINTVLSGLNLTIGASDGVNNVSSGMTEASGVTTSNARRNQTSTAMAEYSSGGTIGSQMTAAFSGESVVVTPTTLVSSDFGQGAYLVIGS